MQKTCYSKSTKRKPGKYNWENLKLPLTVFITVSIDQKTATDFALKQIKATTHPIC